MVGCGSTSAILALEVLEMDVKGSAVQHRLKPRMEASLGCAVRPPPQKGKWGRRCRENMADFCTGLEMTSANRQ